MVEDSNAEEDASRQTSHAANSQRDYQGLSESGAFNGAGFVIRETGIASAPGTARNLQYVGRSTRDDLLRLCVLGRGAGGIVYKALHVPTLRLVAIKKIPVFEADKRQQMVKELKALYQNLVPIMGEGSTTARGGLKEGPCPYIVAFHDAFINPDEGNISIVVEYMDGGSLQDIVDTGGCDNESVLANISYQVLLGLAFVHEKHQVHRDIKPSNLLINHSGAVKVSDFGIVREMEDASMANTFVGTLSYMSPERIAGNSYAYPSDIWSFGLTILTVALGRYPYSTDGGYWGLLHSLRDEPSPHLPDDGSFSRNFQDFVDSCLRKDPAERPSTQTLLDHPFLIGCKENMEAPRRAARQRRAAGGNPRNGQRDGQRRARSNMRARHGPKVRAMEGRGRGKARRRRPAAPLSKNPATRARHARRSAGDSARYRCAQV